MKVPHEAAAHVACWMAWPHLAHEWDDLAAAQSEIAAFIQMIAETEPVHLLVHPEVEPPHLNATFVRVAYGDAWTRDSFPIFGSDRALSFRFDGWGGKYPMPGDEDLSTRMAEHVELPTERFDYVLEGGSVEPDGEGVILTTSTCLLARGADLSTWETRLKRAFDAERVVFLEGALENDHTDGHIDTLARFVEPGHVVCMKDVLGLESQLRDAGFTVSTIPAPSVVHNPDGSIAAASYCNYYLANGQILVPAYGVPEDEPARLALAALFPGRRARSVPGRHIISGGGALHCITQQQPA